MFKEVQIGDEFIRLLIATGNGVLYLLCYFVTTAHTTDCLLIGYEILVVPLLYFAAALDTQVGFILCVVHD